MRNAYEIDEGSSLDLVVAPDTAGAMVTASTLPTNAVLTNGIFSFTPDYTQAGIYSITFTVTAGAGSGATTTTIAVRVRNVVDVRRAGLQEGRGGARRHVLEHRSFLGQSAKVAVSNSPGCAARCRP